jgi:hypothetical protein
MDNTKSGFSRKKGFYIRLILSLCLIAFAFILQAAYLLAQDSDDEEVCYFFNQL